MQQRQIARPNVEKHYDTDWAKAKVHEELRSMLDRTLLKFKKPKDIRVLHFAGIDAQETKSYLRRGIPASNITSIERDPTIAAAQRALGIGINVINGTFEDYAEKRIGQNEKFDFDVISLDFTGVVNPNSLATVSEILKNSKNNNILIHCANLLKRDPGAFSIYSTVVPSVISHHKKDYEKSDTRTLSINNLLEGFDEFKQGFESKDRTDLKRQYYPYLILQYVSGQPGRTDEDIIRFLLSSSSKELADVEKKIIEALESMCGESIGAKNLKDIFEDSFSSFPPFSNYLQQVKKGLITLWLKEYGLEDSGVVTKLDSILADVITEGNIFIPKQSSHYAYISESGSPMIGSIYYVSRSRYVYEAAKDAARLCGFPDEFRIMDVEGFLKAYRTYDKIAHREYFHVSELFDSNSADVKFLGNSSKPVLSKKRFLEELDGGSAIDEIKMKYRGWVDKPLAQWKAHHTMGTYGKIDNMPVESFEDSNVEKITKEEAIDLISSGIPIEEIYDAYPTSFGTGQLRAYKAHITMKTYERR